MREILQEILQTSEAYMRVLLPKDFELWNLLKPDGGEWQREAISKDRVSYHLLLQKLGKVLQEHGKTVRLETAKQALDIILQEGEVEVELNDGKSHQIIRLNDLLEMTST